MHICSSYVLWMSFIIEIRSAFIIIVITLIHTFQGNSTFTVQPPVLMRLSFCGRSRLPPTEWAVANTGQYPTRGSRICIGGRKTLHNTNKARHGQKSGRTLCLSVCPSVCLSKHAGSDPEAFWLRPVMAVMASVQPESSQIVYAGSDFPQPIQFRFSTNKQKQTKNYWIIYPDPIWMAWSNPNTSGLEASRCTWI